MPDASVWDWSQQDTNTLLATISGDLVGLLGVVAVFLLGLGLLARIAR